MFSFDLSKIDFRSTPIENIFLDTYLSQADGDAIKVYLAGWKEAYSKSGQAVSIEALAQSLEMDEDRVAKALDYWNEAGLLEIISLDPPSYRFRSMLMLWSGVAEPAPGPQIVETMEDRETREDKKIIIDEKIIEDEGMSKRREDMFDRLEDFLSADYSYRVLLKDNEIRLILDVMDKYHFSPEYFLYAYQKASSGKEIGARSVNYIVAVIENWARFEGINDKAGLDKFLDEQPTDKKTKRPGRKKRGKFVGSDKRMSRQEEEDWVKKKLEQSRLRGLKGGTHGQGS